MAEKSKEVVRMAGIVAVGIGEALGRYSQEEVFEALGYRYIYRSIFIGAGIKSRPLCLAPKEIVKIEAQEQHENYTKFSLILSRKAIEDCLRKTNIKADEIDHVVFVSCTGMTVPPPSYYLINEIGLRKNVGHTPVVSTGCHGALPALRRAYDFLQTNPNSKVLVVCTEISNAAYFPSEKLDIGLIIANSIFGDGSACALVSDSLPHLEFLDFETYIEPDFIDDIKMPWEKARLRIVLSSRISEIVKEPLKIVAQNLLLRRNLRKEEIKFWAIHSGGASILKSAEETLDLESWQLKFSYQTWEEYGNLSSPTVLIAVQKLIESGELHHGDYVIILGLGAGLECSGILARWKGGR